MAYVVQLENGETHTIFDLKDVKELIDPNLYEVIESININQGTIEKLQHEVKCLECDINSYDASLYALRSDTSECMEYLKDIVNYLGTVKRINRDDIIYKCNKAISSIENSEGW